MSIDYQLIAGIDSAIQAEQGEDGWYTIVRDGEVRTGDLVTDRRRDRTFEVTGLGAPFYVAEVPIEDPASGYCTTVVIDYHEAVRNFVHYETIEVCQAFLEPVRHLHGADQQRDDPIALAQGRR